MCRHIAARSGQRDDQLGPLDLVTGGWRFGDRTPTIQRPSGHVDFHLWLGCSSSSACSSSGFRPALMLRLSALAMETASESIRNRACEEPLRPLKDWTAPPSLGSDHWLVDFFLKFSSEQCSLSVDCFTSSLRSDVFMFLLQLYENAIVEVSLIFPFPFFKSKIGFAQN